MKASLRTTKDYRLFDRSKTNRPVHLEKRAALRASMEKYGWIPAYPMHVMRNGQGRLVITDGQHRFEIAKELGVAVWFVECDEPIDVAEVNQGQKPWNISDYAGTYAQRGIQDYVEVQEFSAKYRIPLSIAAALMSGTLAYRNVFNAFCGGTWKIKDREFAERVAVIIEAASAFCRFAKGRAFVDAVAACCRVRGFSTERMINAIKRCPEKLAPYGTRDAMLVMLEDMYNFGKREMFALRIEAITAMRDRNPTSKKSE